MKRFMNRNFLLETPTSVMLYHEIAEKLPIVECRCNLSSAEIAENKKFADITEIWLYNDNCRQKAMRSCGVDEKYITGFASDYEKFREYCRIMPLLIGNPIYYLSHLDLQKYFNCNLIINSKNCDKIWKITSDNLAMECVGPRDYIEKSKVRFLCTLDDPIDDLCCYEKNQRLGVNFQAFPSFCPDNIFNIGQRGITEYVFALGRRFNINISDYESLCRAYLISLDRFDALGCKTANHGIDQYVSFAKPDKYHANEIFKKALASDGADIDKSEIALWQTQMLRFFGSEYKKRNWVLQIHRERYCNKSKTDFFKKDTQSDHDTWYIPSNVTDIVNILTYLQNNGALPKTVIYPINFADNMVVASLCDSLYRCGKNNTSTVVPGNTLFFYDRANTVESQIKIIAGLYPLGSLPGLMTDVRCLNTYSGYEYFRRIVCNVIGKWVEEGLYPNFNSAADIIARVSYYNAVGFFGFDTDNY